MNKVKVVLVRATVHQTPDAYSGAFGEEILAESLSTGALASYLEHADPSVGVV